MVDWIYVKKEQSRLRIRTIDCLQCLNVCLKCYQSFIYVNETHQDWTKNHILASMNSQQAFSIHYKSCLGGLG